MPGKLKVRVLAGRDLPVMDRVSELTDAFVEIRFGSTSHKTDVFKKSLNPQWNSDWFKFEVDDEELQDEPLQIKVLDHDTYSAHDSIGKVYIDLNPLLSKGGNSMINGWFPIYDTMHGIRGELHCLVKVDLFSDFNKFRQSSCGVHFFCTSGIPVGYKVSAIHGFVEELVVNDDPEYKWIDKIRSQRASNEARQILFSKLSGELQRRIGLKVLEMGGDSVIGYQQHFDLEGETGVVVRGIGTSVSLQKYSYLMTSPTHSSSPVSFPLPEEHVIPSSPTNITPTRLSASPAKPVPLTRRSSDSDIGTPPKAGSVGGSSGSGGGSGQKAPFHRPVLQQESIDMLEYPFFTIKSFPPGFIVHLGGVVSARSVKLLDRIHNPDEPETRDAWWLEIRTEIRSHTRAMGCHAVVGYHELTTICGDIIVLSACGTAAIVNMKLDTEATLKQVSASPNPLTTSLDRHHFEKEKERVSLSVEKDKKLHVDVNLANQVASQRLSHYADGLDECNVIPSCTICHVPYNDGSLPFPVNLAKCHVCRRHKVPDILFTTIEPPAELLVVGKGCFIQARICRQKKEAKGETNAKEISDSLPFMEYELHNQLLNKLKIRGMNSLFGLKIQVTVGEKLLVAVATATAVFSAALPVPPLPKLCSKIDGTTTDKKVQDVRKRILENINKNKEAYNLNQNDSFPPDASPKTDESEDELNDIELSAGNKDTFVLEIDDAEDAAEITMYLEQPFPDGFDVCNTEMLPGQNNLVCNLQFFTRVWRGELKTINNSAFSQLFDQLFKSLCFKLRGATPCCLGHLDWDVEIPDEGEIQISVTGICMGEGEPQTVSNGLVDIAPEAKLSVEPNLKASSDTEDMLFHMEGVSDPSATLISKDSLRARPLAKSSDKRIRYHSGPKQKHGIEITSLSYIPRARIVSYVGHLNFFLIRESTSIREGGGLNGFMHSFVAEVMAICRAHVSALGGTALVAYSMSECVLEDNLHKNQSQCLVNVSGDVVNVSYGYEPLPSYTPGNVSVKSGSVSPMPIESKSRKLSPKNSPQESPNNRSSAV